MKLEYSKSSQKSLKRLSQKKRIKALLIIGEITKNPLVGKKLKGKLSQLRSIKVWPYRIVYYYNKKSKYLFIDEIEHRQGVYR